MNYEVQIMTRSHDPKWKYEWGSKFESDAIQEAGARNRSWAAGEAIHRVVAKGTEREVYRRGWLKEFTHLQK